MLVVGVGLVDGDRHGSDLVEELPHPLLLALDAAGQHSSEVTRERLADLVPNEFRKVPQFVSEVLYVYYIVLLTLLRGLAGHRSQASSKTCPCRGSSWQTPTYAYGCISSSRKLTI